MSVLKTIDRIPLFNRQSLAETWGEQYGLSGYHTHIIEEGVYKGQTGYMAGNSHEQAVIAFNSGPVSQKTQTSPTTTNDIYY